MTPSVPSHDLSEFESLRKSLSQDSLIPQIIPKDTILYIRAIDLPEGEDIRLTHGPISLEQTLENNITKSGLWDDPTTLQYAQALVVCTTQDLKLIHCTTSKFLIEQAIAEGADQKAYRRFPHLPIGTAWSFRVHILPWLVETTYGAAGDGIVERSGTIHLHNPSKLKNLGLIEVGKK